MDWDRVETFGSTGDEPLDHVDAALATADVVRLRSGSGERAILVPAAQLAGPLTATGLSPAATHVLFLDPAAAHAVPALLRAAGRPAQSVRVAVAGTAAPAGLTADTGRIDAGPAVSFRLYRTADAPSIAPGPRIGESPDVTDARSRWFGTRHRGPDG